ncbi:MAG: hypothetical protein NTY03_03200 [Candidatus Bathyarchaeota archaeon]|nr:hypothetical protein [Candidatus Bathyarchaeota archaeon]
MKREQPSLTALGNAAFRALESEKKQNEKICDDPYARKFVPTLLYYIEVHPSHRLRRIEEPGCNGSPRNT